MLLLPFEKLQEIAADLDKRSITPPGIIIADTLPHELTPDAPFWPRKERDKLIHRSKTWSQLLKSVHEDSPWAEQVMGAILYDVSRMDDRLLESFKRYDGCFLIGKDFARLEQHGAPSMYAFYSDKDELVAYNAGQDLNEHYFLLDHVPNITAHELMHSVDTLNYLGKSSAFSTALKVDKLVKGENSFSDIIRNNVVERAPQYRHADRGSELFADVGEYMLGDPKNTVYDSPIFSAFIQNMVLPSIAIGTLPQGKRAAASRALDGLAYSFPDSHLPKKEQAEFSKLYGSLKRVRDEIKDCIEGDEWKKKMLEAEAAADAKKLEKLLVQAFEIMGQRFTSEFNLPPPLKISGMERDL